MSVEAALASALAQLVSDKLSKTYRLEVNLDKVAAQKLIHAAVVSRAKSYSEILDQLILNAPVDEHGCFVGVSLPGQPEPRREVKITKYVADGSGELHEVNPEGRSVKRRPSS